MTILADWQIRKMAEAGGIENFVPESIRKAEATGNKVISYGTSSYGYDVRLDKNFKIFTNINAHLIDPKRLDEKTLVDVVAEHDDYGDRAIIIPPNSYALGVTLEYFRMPRNITALCIGKSTYARAGLIVNCTPIEAGWEGNIVIELANSTPIPIKVYAMEGIAQLLFFEGEECEVSYADRGGKYQKQTGITLPR